MVQPEKTSRAILFSWSPPQIWSKIVHFKFNFQEAKIIAVEGVTKAKT